MDSTLPEDDQVLFTANQDLRGLDAESFATLRRLYVQMGLLLHDHGIETLPQLESVLKSAGLNRVSPETKDISSS
jgi:hypothetical protein